MHSFNGRQRRSMSIAAAAIAMGTCFETDAVAQTSAIDASSVLEEVVVTARRREESLQRVPIAVSVLSGAAIADGNINDIRDLFRQVPGLSLNAPTGPRLTTTTIRGIGSIVDNPTQYDDSTVTYYVDEAPLPKFASDVAFFDLGRVEVLRGPQGTLFGQNTTAGAINITSKEPTDALYLEGAAGYGNRDLIEAELIASGPVFGDALKARVALKHRERKEGYVRNLYNGKLLGESEQTIAKLTLAGDLGERSRYRLMSIGQRDRADGLLQVLAPKVSIYAYPSVNFSRPTSITRDVSHTVLSLPHDFDGFTLTSTTGLTFLKSTFQGDDSIADIFRQDPRPSITSFRNAEQIISSTGYFIPANAFGPGVPSVGFQATPPIPGYSFDDPARDYRDSREDQIVVSQEIKLASNAEGSFSWVGGANVFYTQLDFRQEGDTTVFAVLQALGRTLQGQQPPLGPGSAGRDINFDNEHEKLGLGAFFEGTYRATDRFAATAGLRYTHDEKKAHYVSTCASGRCASTVFEERLSKDWSFLTGRVSASYQINDDILTYATVSRGAKAGGYPEFQTLYYVDIGENAYDTTKISAYEGGLKSEFFDHRLRLNLAGFYNDVTDEQLQFYRAPAYAAAFDSLDLETYGIEAEFVAKPINGLELSGFVSWTQGEIVNGSSASGALPGNKVPNLPEWRVNLNAQYQAQISGRASLFARAEYQWQDERYAQPDNDLLLSHYAVTNLRVGFRLNNIEVTAYVDNVFEEDYATFAFNFAPTLTTVIPNEPRSIGIDVRFRN